MIRTRTVIVVGLSALGLAAAGAGCGGTCEGAGNICTFMGEPGIAGLGHDGVEPTAVRLYLPQDLTFSPDGQPYVLDWNNHRIRTVDGDGLVQTAVGTGELGDAPDGKVAETRLNHPTHISFGPDGHAYVSAWHNSKVSRVDFGAGTITAVAGTGGRDFGGEGGPALAAILDLPVSTAFDADGRLLIMDQGNQRIRRVNDDGNIQTLVGPVGPYIPEGWVQVCTPPAQEGQAPTCKFCREDQAADPACPGPPARPQGFRGEDADGTTAFMHQPFSQSAPPAGRMEMGPDGVLYFVDTGNHLVRAMRADGTVYTVAGTPPAPYDPTESVAKKPAGDFADGAAAEAKFNTPSDLAVASDGTIYVADTYNSCVRRIDTDGNVSTFAGKCGEVDLEPTEQRFAGDGGPAADALLDRPYGVALDADGNLYIADTHNHVIRVVYAGGA